MSDNNYKNPEINKLKEFISEAIASINVLFLRPENNHLNCIDIYRKSFIDKYLTTLNTVYDDLSALNANTATAKRYSTVIVNTADSIDYINDLTVQCTDKSLIKNLELCVFDALAAHGVFSGRSCDSFILNETGKFLLFHGERVCRNSKSLLLFLNILEKNIVNKGTLSRVRPEVQLLFDGETEIKLKRGSVSAETMTMLSVKAKDADPFNGNRAFRYINNNFYPAELTSIRQIDKFFGFVGVRKTFSEHFNDFSKGVTNLPFLISSLPGLGKTHLAISHALAHDNLTLILPEPEDLEKGLELLIRKLAARKDHRFVVFFDDIDPGKINWYYFRTNIGGSFILPNNICIVIASNFEFPANILSRGRSVKFPIFDEIKCTEMVEDFLLALGMKHCNNDLISVIAADYVEEFAQRKFEELSPRTLIRYLEIYEKDIKKRKRMLEFSRAEMITRPDSKIFYDFNIKLMKMLYGAEIIDVIREEKLKEELSK